MDADPTADPTPDPVHDPTADPTADPVHDPTADPAADPVHDPTADPAADLARLRRTVTDAVLVEAIEAIAGATIAVGPVRAGPGGVATATAAGAVAPAQVCSAEPGEGGLVFELRLPVTIDLDVVVTGRRSRFGVDALVHVHAVVTRDGADAVLTVAPLTGRHVTVEVHPRGLQARLLRSVGDVDREIRREVAAYVNGRVDGEDVRRHTRRPLAG